MVRPVEWEVDENTRVRIVYLENGDPEIHLVQGEGDCVMLCRSGASPTLMAESIIAAIEATAHFEMPDLHCYGYEIAD